MSASLVGSEMCIRDRPPTRCKERPPCAKSKIASRVRTWNCAGPRAPSKLAPEPPDGLSLIHI
eukprot:12856746-Alexandrium_andersonii.AAC.1